MAYKTTLIKHSRRPYMTSIPQNEALTAMKDLNPKAYQLLIYYYSRLDGWKFDDEEIARTIGTTERMVKTYRKELIEKEYLWIAKGDLTVYFVGRKAVGEFKYSPTQEDDEAKLEEGK